MLKDLPQTTELLFIDESLAKNNPLVAQLASVGAIIQSFIPLNGIALTEWIKKQVEENQYARQQYRIVS